jgi:antibiotic biosynthesis monooxygenase (ABM) superfamily enzyme
MKFKPWNLIVFLVVLLTIVAFEFFFKEEKISPKIGNIPFAFWSGFLLTVVIVLFTYLGAKFFPHKDNSGK